MSGLINHSPSEPNYDEEAEPKDKYNITWYEKGVNENNQNGVEEPMPNIER